jgi:nicotinamidase-related amidase
LEEAVALTLIYHTLEDTVQPAHTALVVIDVQNDFRLPSYEAMIARLRKLIAAARQSGVFVVYIQNSVVPGLSNSASEIARRQKLGLTIDTTIIGSEGEKIVPELSPQAGDPVIRKHRLNAFAGTDLQMLLQIRGIETLIITGVATHGCVTGTSYAAQGLNYYVVLAEDCVASWAADLHEAALHVLRKTMNYATPSDILTQIWLAGGAQGEHGQSGSSLSAVG